MPSAFVAMRKGGHRGSGKRESTFVPTIVFHGDADKTVHAINGEQVISQSISHATIAPTVEHGRSPGGVSYTRKIWRDAAANTHSEQWLLHGTGHAWSGGSASGSYSDPRGPDASREIIRFFCQTQCGEPLRNEQQGGTRRRQQRQVPKAAWVVFSGSLVARAGVSLRVAYLAKG